MYSENAFECEISIYDIGLMLGLLVKCLITLTFSSLTLDECHYF